MSETFDLAGSLANYDLNESSLRRLLAERMARLAEERKRGIQNSQQNQSARGMLQSTNALDNIGETNLGFDRQVGDTNQSFNDDLMKIAQGRVDANNQYQMYLQNMAKTNAANTQTFDPTDPYNWKGIAAEQARNGISQPPVDNPDPLNWGAIDSAIRGGQVQDPRMTPKPAASMRPRTIAKPETTKPIASTKPKQGYY